MAKILPDIFRGNCEHNKAVSYDPRYEATQCDRVPHTQTPSSQHQFQEVLRINVLE